MGIMGADRDPAEAEVERRERAARKEQEQRERRDAKLRADMIREGRDRPDNEFLGLGVVIHDEEVLVWSTTIKHVLGPWSARKLESLAQSRPEVRAPPLRPPQPSGRLARSGLSAPAAQSRLPTWYSLTGHSIRTSSPINESRPELKPMSCASTR